MTDQPDAFPDTQQLLESSMPHAHRGWFWYGAGAFLLVVMISTYLGMEYPAVVNLISLLALFVLMGTMMGITFAAVKRQRREQEQLQTASELVQLRRWPEAGGLLQNILSTPARTHGMRAQSL